MDKLAKYYGVVVTTAGSCLVLNLHDWIP